MSDHQQLKPCTHLPYLSDIECMVYMCPGWKPQRQAIIDAALRLRALIDVDRMGISSHYNEAMIGKPCRDAFMRATDPVHGLQPCPYRDSDGAMCGAEIIEGGWYCDKHEPIYGKAVSEAGSAKLREGTLKDSARATAGAGEGVGPAGSAPTIAPELRFAHIHPCGTCGETYCEHPPRSIPIAELDERTEGRLSPRVEHMRNVTNSGIPSNQAIKAFEGRPGPCCLAAQSDIEHNIRVVLDMLEEEGVPLTYYQATAILTAAKHFGT